MVYKPYYLYCDGPHPYRFGSVGTLQVYLPYFIYFLVHGTDKTLNCLLDDDNPFCIGNKIGVLTAHEGLKDQFLTITFAGAAEHRQKDATHSILAEVIVLDGIRGEVKDFNSEIIFV